MNARDYNFAILMDPSNPNNTHMDWVNAIEESPHNIDYEIVNLASTEWLRLFEKTFDMLLISPPLLTTRTKKLFDERLYVLSTIKKISVYPQYSTFLVYENKKLLSYCMHSLGIPHPRTFVFYDKSEALEYIESFTHPIVAKTNIGAAGLGVKMLKNKNDGIKYIEKAFKKGIRSKTGPDFRKPNIIARIYKAFKTSGYVKLKLSNYIAHMKDRQNGYVYFQEFIPHAYEWRCVRIDESYFAHKKIVVDSMASGYLKKEYDPPPISLLSFVKDISEKMNILSAAFDIFEIGKNQYLVNEVQTFFGQSDSYQMLVNGVPGRYVYSMHNWQFEQGDFNRNKSYNLRLSHVLKLLNNSGERS
jgi:glutathione synthase/RimK-type ligase-like ATP-grasp enzyme